MPITNKRNLNDHVFERLQEMIITGELKPGEKLIETNLTELLNTSRTPIRDALRRLERGNLVKQKPSQSAEVSKLSKNTIVNLYECRAVLEGLAVRQAIHNIGSEDLKIIQEAILLSRHYFSNKDMQKTVEKNTIFHETLINASKNMPLIQMMDNIRTQIFRYRNLTSSLGFKETFVEEHTEILDAVREKKVDLAESLMKKHILSDLDNFLIALHNDYLEIEEN